MCEAVRTPKEMEDGVRQLASDPLAHAEAKRTLLEDKYLQPLTRSKSISAKTEQDLVTRLYESREKERALAERLDQAFNAPKAHKKLSDDEWQETISRLNVPKAVR